MPGNAEERSSAFSFVRRLSVPKDLGRRKTDFRCPVPYETSDFEITSYEPFVFQHFIFQHFVFHHSISLLARGCLAMQ